MRKINALFIVLVMILSSINFVYASTDIIVHYNREDGNYTDWEIWGWAEGKDGQNFAFTEEDAFGAVSHISLDDDTSSVGFIIKKPDWSKDFDGDRFIDLSKGNEIWIFSGEEGFTYEPPAGYESEKEEKSFNLQLVYDKYDGDYENLTFRYYEKDNESNSGFAKISNNKPINIPITSKNNLHFSIYKKDKVYDYEDSIIFINKATAEKPFKVNMVQGADKVVYGDISLDNEIEKALIVNVDEIQVWFKKPIEITNLRDKVFIENSKGKVQYDEILVVRDSNRYKKLETGYGSVFSLKTEKLDFSEEYFISEMNSSDKEEILLGDIYDTEEFVSTFTYRGDDLGATYSPENTKFRVWAPTAKNLELYIYNKAEKTNNIPDEVVPMIKDVNGTWVVTLDGNQDGLMYNYGVDVNGENNVAVDPYAKAVTINGNKGVVLNDENHQVATEYELPEIRQIDSVIYEIHVRDLSMDSSSGIENEGKFLGFTEKGTKSGEVSTGLDHILDLGVTHVHLLPSFDYASVDEEKNNQFNWGYDPKNYNVPEGSYSTNPHDPINRIIEFKEMVNTLHENGVRVVMDVVYNHMYSAEASGFEKLVPGYYFRMNGDKYYNGSGCGNETASERPMMKKFMVDSVKYWATEYNIDGFRFDLMALHDIDTMNMIKEELETINPDIIVYGEGWDAGGSPVDESLKALKKNASSLNSEIAFFSDDMRDGIKGSVFNDLEPGFVSGSKQKTDDVMFGIVGSVQHPQVLIGRVDYSDNYWASEPTQTINYASAHDNLSLYDKLLASTQATDEDIIEMNKMSAAIIMTSQGIPFFQAGEEIARTKDGDHNSYKSSDRINSIKWDTKADRIDLYNYYKGLIALRKETGAFKYETQEEIVNNLEFFDTEENIIAYTVNGTEDDKYKKYIVAFNPTSTDYELAVDNGGYNVLVNDKNAGTEVISTVFGDKLIVKANSSYVFAYNDYEDGFVAIGVVLGIVAILSVAVILFSKNKK